MARPKGMTDEGLSKVASAGLNLRDAGSAEVLPIDQINVDPEYQRTLRHDLVEKIRREWDIVKAGPILVSQRQDGTLWCVDGQHRMVGAQGAGETEIFAHVVHGLTKEEEAALRLARNDRRSDNTFEKFKTRLVMGDPVAHRLVELAHQFHTQINLEASAYVGINCIAAVEQLYNIDYGSVLTKVFKALSDAYGEDALHGRVVSVAMLKSVAWFNDRHVERHEANYSEFIERLSTVGVDDIDRRARSHKAALGGSLWLNYYRALVEVWNFRRQDKNKLEWRVQGSITTMGGDSSKPGREKQGSRGTFDRGGGGNA
jgi:hypothetical protein